MKSILVPGDMVQVDEAYTYTKVKVGLYEEPYGSTTFALTWTGVYLEPGELCLVLATSSPNDAFVLCGTQLGWIDEKRTRQVKQ